MNPDAFIHALSAAVIEQMRTGKPFRKAADEQRFGFSGCIDAPTLIPSGGLQRVQTGPDPEDWGIESEIERAGAKP